MYKEKFFRFLIILALSIENCMAPPEGEASDIENAHTVVHRLPQHIDHDDDFDAPLGLHHVTLEDADVQRELKRWLEYRLKKEALDAEYEEFVQQVALLREAQDALTAKQENGEGDDGFVLVPLKDDEQDNLDTAFQHVEWVYEQLVPRRVAVDQELIGLDLKFFLLPADVSESFLNEARENQRKAILAKMKKDAIDDAQAFEDLTMSIGQLQKEFDLLTASEK